MPKLTDDQIYERLRTYLGEFSTLVRLRAPKQQLLNGDGSRHGLNHIVETFQMLPEDSSAEFRIRE